MPKQAKIAIPVALLSALIAIVIWLSNNALATESRITCVETELRGTDKSLVDIKDDIKEIKQDIKLILSNRREVPRGDE